MKAILISIKPKYVADILNGKKTIEIRKSMPKCDLPIDVYIYCTKGKSDISLFTKSLVLQKDKTIKNYVCGKVIAKFTLTKIEPIYWIWDSIYKDNFPRTETLETRELLKQSCLGEDEFNEYVGDNFSYAWHVEDLVIFDRPRDIKEFKVHWPPQSWQFIEV